MIFEKVERVNLLTSYFWGNGVKSNENTFDFVDFGLISSIWMQNKAE